MTNLQLTHPLPDSSELPKGLHTLLQKLSFKHEFKTAPNRMSEVEMCVKLKEGMNERYKDLFLFYVDLQNTINRKKWFGLI